MVVDRMYEYEQYTDVEMAVVITEKIKDSGATILHGENSCTGVLYTGKACFSDGLLTIRDEQRGAGVSAPIQTTHVSLQEAINIIATYDIIYVQ